MNEKFNVLLTGQMSGDKTLAEVIGNLAALFRVPKERASELLTDAPVVIKGSIDFVTGEKCIAIVERAGARCRIEPARQLELNFKALPVATPSPAPPSARAPVPAPVAVQVQIPDSREAAATPPPVSQLLASINTREDLRLALLSTDESIRFEGPVVRQAATSFPNFFKDGTGRVPSDFDCFITKKRLLLICGNKLFLDLPGEDIQSITRNRMGITIWHGANETTLAFADKSGGEDALARLKDPSPGGVPAPVEQENLRTPSVINGWGIALSPLVGGVINAILMTFLHLRVILLWYAFSVAFALIDKMTMPQKGRGTRTDGPGFPYFVPWYLFARARASGHRKSYAIVGCVLFAIALILEGMLAYQHFGRIWIMSPFKFFSIYGPRFFGASN